MASKKKTTRSKAARNKAAARKTTSRASRKTTSSGVWEQALDTLHKAQAEAEKQVAELLEANGFKSRDVAGAVREVRRRYEKQRRSVIKQLEAQVDNIEERVSRERKAIGRGLDQAVRDALAALNIPSRKEVAELGRKVDQLSKKIDGLRRR